MMNILNKAALKGLKRNPARTMVTIIGVILSAVMITAVTTFASSLQKYMVNGSIVKYGNWHVEFLDINSSFVKEQVKDNRVTNICTFKDIGYANLEEGKNPNKPYLFIAGFSKESFENLPVKIISGRLPQNSKEIIIPKHVATNGGVKISVGDNISLSVGKRMKENKNLTQHDIYVSGEETIVLNKEITYKVVGICERPAFEEYTAPGYTLITTMDEGDNEDNLSGFVRLKNPKEAYSYANSANGNYQYIFNEEVLRFMGLSNDNTFNRLIYSVGSILILLIVIGSIFLIYNSFTISLNDKTHQLGILMSVGATKKQLINSVLFEGICIGIIGIPVGILIGIPSIKILLSFVSRYFRSILYNNVPLALSISIPAIMVTAVICMITILISAYIPARKAVKISVMDCIRQTNEIKINSKTVKTSKFIKKIYGLEGVLALKNFKRNKRPYKSVILSLTLSVVLFVSTSVFGLHLNEIAKKIVTDNDYDICFYTKDMNEDNMFKLYDKLKTAKGVYESSYQTILTYSCLVKSDDFSEGYKKDAGYEMSDKEVDLLMDIQFIEDNIYLDFVKSLGLPIEEYTGNNAKIITVAKVDIGKEGNNDKKEKVDMFSRNSMNVTISPKSDKGETIEEKKNVDLTLVDKVPLDALPRTIYESHQYFFFAVMPYSLKDNFEYKNMYKEMGLTFRAENPSQTVEEMKTMIEAAGVNSDYDLYNYFELFEQNRNIIFIVNLFTVVFVTMLSLIAIANVLNTISTNIKLRRRELAMLKSLGMSNHDFNKMICFECLFYGLKTLLFGIPISSLLSWFIYKGLVIGGADIKFVFPWVSIIISILGVFFVIFITTLYALIKIKKENIIDTLRDDII